MYVYNSSLREIKPILIKHCTQMYYWIDLFQTHSLFNIQDSGWFSVENQILNQMKLICEYDSKYP